ncbi:MAG TPA: FliM/FliN family flagellar motor switch protein [Polyangiaceae bacterium]|nr:FliM/FliN family flagellar motor switch protein [Polyangiaceae bacterium]
MSEPAPFPWAGVPRVPRASLRARRELLQRLDAALDWQGIGRALGDLLGADVQLGPVQTDCRREGVPFVGEQCLELRFPVHGLRLWLEPERDLWRSCVARLLDQEFQLGWADTSIEAALRGAGAALALEVARRAARAEAPELASEQPREPGWLLHAGASLRLGGKLYRVAACAALERAGAPGLRAPIELRRLGALPLRVPWVAALSSAPLTTLESLALGDVWLPGAEAWVAGETPRSAGLLVPPRSRRGIPVRVQGGRTVLGAEIVAVPEEAPPGEMGAPMSQQESELEQVVGETPVVVRLELGAIEMSAAEWAALRPGDVLASGCRVEEGVSLRTGGREIARGELVEIDGEIGVRITRVGCARVGP